MGTPGESEDAVLLAVEEARRRDVTVGTAVTYIPAREPWPGPCTDPNYVELLRSPTLLTYELFPTAENDSRVGVRIKYELDSLVLSQVERLIAFDQQPRVTPHLPVGIQLGEGSGGGVRMQVSVDLDLLESMRVQGTRAYIPSSVFTPVDESDLIVSDEPVIDVNFDLDDMGVPIVDISVVAAAISPTPPSSRATPDPSKNVVAVAEGEAGSPPPSKEWQDRMRNAQKEVDAAERQRQIEQLELERKLEKEARLQDVRQANATLLKMQTQDEEARMKKIRAEAEARGEIKRQDAAARVITANLRRNMEQRMTDKQRTKKHKQATKIQAVWRRKQATRRVEMEREKQKAKAIEERIRGREDLAATRIQSLRRGQRDRARVDRIKESQQRAAEHKAGLRGIQELRKQSAGEEKTAVAVEEEKKPGEDENFTVVQTVQQVRRVKLPVRQKNKVVMKEFVVIDHHHIHHHHHFHRGDRGRPAQDFRPLELKAQSESGPMPPSSLPPGVGKEPLPPAKPRGGKNSARAR